MKEKVRTYITDLLKAIGGGFLLSVIMYFLLLRGHMRPGVLIETVILLLAAAATVRFLSDLIGIVLGWGRSILAAGALIATGIVLYVAVTQTFGIYLPDASSAWDGYRTSVPQGQTPFLWGRGMPTVVLQWLALAFLTIWVVRAIATRKRNPNGKMGRLPKLALAAIVILFLCRVLFPVWNATWPAKRADVDNSLAQNGVVATLGQQTGGLPQYATVAPQPLTQQPLIAAPSQSVEDWWNRGVCADALDPSDINDTVDVVKYPDDCFGEVTKLPDAYNSGYCYQPLTGEGETDDPDWNISFQFVSKDSNGNWIPDGAPLGPYHWEVPLAPQDAPDFNRRPLTFRLKGHHTLHGGITFYAGQHGTCGPKSG